MSQRPLYIGFVVRRLRKQRGLTQSTMSGRLGISTSYLNLIERNQRPVTSRVLMQLMSEFGVDPLSLQADAATGGLDGLARRLGDMRFADLGIDKAEIEQFLSAAPHIATAFARVYDNAPQPAADSSGPAVAVRRFIEHWRNHFADLDHSAEQLADELRLSRGDIGTALAEHLRNRHQLSVRYLPQDAMPGLVRRLDLHARQVQLSEMLDPATRILQLALQVGRLEQGEQVTLLAASSDPMTDRSARILLERHLYDYFANAVLMPYGRFLRAAVATAYDLPVLQRRFGVRFDQLARRLTTLQRVGQRGLPFFTARVDAAGQFSQVLTGASGATFLPGGDIAATGSCPLWRVHSASCFPAQLQVQRIEVEGVVPGDWTTIASRVGSDDGTECSHAVVVGVETRFAPEVSHFRARASGDATPTGRGCAVCYRLSCTHRAVPAADTVLPDDGMVERQAPLGAPTDYADG